MLLRRIPVGTRFLFLSQRTFGQIILRSDVIDTQEGSFFSFLLKLMEQVN